MLGDIIYDEQNDENITSDQFNMVSDDNKHFAHTSWYLRNNVKFNLDIIPIILINLNINSRKVLAYIITHLKYNTNIIKINRKDVITYLDTNDYSIVTKGIKELSELGIIIPLKDRGKDVYQIPMNFLVRGNVNSMVTSFEEEEKEQERIRKENAQVKSYKELSELHKFKIKIKNSKSKNNESKNQEIE